MERCVKEYYEVNDYTLSVHGCSKAFVHVFPLQTNLGWLFAQFTYDPWLLRKWHVKRGNSIGQLLQTHMC